MSMSQGHNRRCLFGLQDSEVKALSRSALMGSKPKGYCFNLFNEFRIFFLKFSVISIGHTGGHLHQENHKKET